MAEYLDKIRPVLVALQIGETVDFPIARLKSVRIKVTKLNINH